MADINEWAAKQRAALKAKLAAEKAAQEPAPVEKAPTPADAPVEAPAPALPSAAPPSAATPRAASAASVPAPKPRPPAPPPAPTPKPRTLDEVADAAERAFDARPEQVQKRAERAIARSAEALRAKVPEVEKTTPIEPFKVVTEGAKALRKEGALITEGTRDIVQFAGDVVPAAGAVVRAKAYDRFEDTLRDPSVVGAFAVAKGDSLTAKVGSAARQAARQQADKARAELSDAARRAEEQRLAQQALKRQMAPAPGVDLAAARKLAEAIDTETDKDRAAKAREFTRRYVQKRLAEQGWESVTDGPRAAEMEAKAKREALAQLVRLRSEGTVDWIPEDALFGDDAETWSEKAGGIVPYLPDTAGAALGGAAAIADSRLVQAFKSQRRVLESGDVARGESIPGWLLNTVVGGTDFAVTTALDAALKEEAPTLEQFAKNVEARRSATQWRIEQDEQLQADLASGDPDRIVSALQKLAPYALLELTTPDAVSVAGGVLKLPGMAADAARITARSKRITDAVRAADKGARAAAAVDALRAVAKEVRAERAARPGLLDDLKEATRGEFADSTALGRVDAEGEARMVGAALERADGDATRVPDILDELGSPEAATVLRDNIAARLAADPDIVAYRQNAGYSGPYRDYDVGAAVRTEGVDEAQVAAARRGQEKYPQAYAEAAEAAVKDFRAVGSGSSSPSVRAREVAPVPDVTPEEVADLLGAEGGSPALAQRIANAETPKDLADVLSRAPESVRSRIATRFGYDSYQDLVRVARTDVADATAKAAKLRQDLAVEQAALAQDLDRVAAIKTGPAEVKRYNEARTRVKAAEKALAAADKEAGQFADGTHPTLRALFAASAEARKKVKDIPEFELPKGITNDLARLDRDKERLANAKLTPAARKKLQQSITRRRLQYAQEIPAYRAMYEAKFASMRQAQQDALAKVRAARDAAAEAQTRVEQARAKARQDLVAAQAAYAGTSPPRRPVAQMTPTARRIFSYLGEPVYRRGYVVRPPMEFALDTGYATHLLDLSVGVDFTAAKKYLGPGAEDFAQQAKNIPHAGRPLPHFPDLSTKGQFAVVKAKNPDTGKVKSYNPGNKHVEGGWAAEVEWRPPAEAWWAWADEVAARHPGLPRAKSNNEYFRALSAWADPGTAPEDVDIIRLDDTVFVNDPKVARAVGDINQPIPFESRVADPNGDVARFAPQTLDGVPGRVVGFRPSKTDGAPVLVIQPQEFNGSRLVDANKPPVEVRPEAAVFIDRRKDAATLRTDAEWAELRAQEDAMPGARTARYADKDRFVPLAPPERPTPTDFNYNPDHPQLRWLFDEETQAAIRERVGEDGVVAAQTRKGIDGEAELAKAEQVVEKRQTRIAELQQAVDKLVADAGQVDSLQRAMSADRPLYDDLARRMRAQQAASPDRVILPEMDLTDLQGDLEAVGRTLERATRKGLGARLVAIGERLYDLGRPAREVEQQALTPLARDVTRKFEGAMRATTEDLARAFQEFDPKATDLNPRTRAILEQYAPSVRSSLRNKGAQAETLTAMATAYLRDPSRLNRDQLRDLMRVVKDWALTDNGPEALRDNLLAATRATAPDFELRFVQEGDVFLAHPFSVEGAWRDTLAEANAKGLATNPEGARAVNTYLDNVTGVRYQGGRPEATLGRRILADSMVPESHRGSVKDFRDLGGRDPVRAPFVQGTGDKGASTARGLSADDAKLREDAVRAVDEVLERTKEILDSDVYVPLPMREALNKELDAVIATARIGRDSGLSLALVDAWKQFVVLGTFTSKPNQYVMDFYGDVVATAAMTNPGIAAKVAARSLLAQFLGTTGAAQVFNLADKSRVAAGQRIAAKGADATDFEKWLRAKLVNENVEPGDTAQDLVALLTFTPEIDAITRRDPTAQINGVPVTEIHDQWRRDGVFESFSVGQFSRSVDTLAARMQQTRLGSAVDLAYQDNVQALQRMKNIADTRRRVAVAYTLLEAGMSPEEAGRKAVEIVGDFAGEMHPIERGLLSTIFPFYSYRKFNARRALKTAMSPFWLTRVQKLQEGSAAVASWFLDDSDEFGFHTESMDTEPDPEVLGQITSDLARQNPHLDSAGPEFQQIVADVLEDGEWNGQPIPTARARYDRVYAQLVEIQRTQGRQAALAAAKADPYLQAYWAPDPVKTALPEWAQDRYAVWLQENRDQATDSWWRSGIGRYERTGDVQRFALYPSDPNTTGIAEALAVAGVAAAVGRMFATATGVDAGPASPSDALEGFFQNPAVQLLAGAGSGVDLENAAAPRRVPDWLGELLSGRLTYPVYEQVRGQDPTQGATGKFRKRYEMAPDVVNALYMTPVIGRLVLGALDAEQVFSGAVLGKVRDAGPVDAVDTATARVATPFFGQRTYGSSPTVDAAIASRAADKRVARATERLPNDLITYQLEDPVVAERAITSHLASATKAEEQSAAVLGVAAGRQPEDSDYVPMRGYLVEQGVPMKRAVRMTPAEVVAAVKKTLAEKEATR